MDHKIFKSPIVDLRNLYLESRDMAQGIHQQHPLQVNQLESEYTRQLGMIKALIALADQFDDDHNTENGGGGGEIGASKETHEVQLLLLQEMLGIASEARKKEEGETRRRAISSSSTANEIKINNNCTCGNENKSASSKEPDEWTLNELEFGDVDQPHDQFSSMSPAPFVFDVKYLPQLVKSIPPLKDAMQAYIRSLRQLALVT